MPDPTPEELWQLLVRSRLLEPAAAATLRADHAAAAADDGSSRALAGWLTRRGAITRWQAKRLLSGDTGPFFVGGYRLLERHERKGDTVSFTARHEPSGRLVTVVLLNAARARDPDVWAGISAHVALARRMTDPTTSRTWSLERQDGASFVVCEHVAGEHLADELERLGPLPPREAAELVLRVARAVGEIHAVGGVHGSLSLDAVRREPAPPGGPERHGRVRLLQFPLAGDPCAAVSAASAGDAAAGARLGRRATSLAPERIGPDGKASPRSDVYALGGLLHALLTGRPPGRNGGVTAAGAAPALDLGPLPATVPPPLGEIVATMTAVDPERRYGDAREAARALELALGLATPAAESADAAPIPVIDTSGPRGRPRGTKGRGILWPLAAAGAVAILTVVVFSRVARGPARPPAGASARPLPGRRAERNDAAAPGSGSDEGRSPRAAASAPRLEVPAAADQSAAADIPAAADEPADAFRSALVPEVVVESPDLPWASPTRGPPPRLAYLPPGSQGVLLIRVADIDADGEGRLLVQALGPAVEAAFATIVRLCGGDASAIELVQVGWQSGGPDDVLGGCAVWFAAGRSPPLDDAARAAAWGPTVRSEIEGETIHQSETLAAWLPAAEAGRVLVIAPRTTVPRIDGLEAAAEEPLIARIIRETLPLAADRQAPLQAALPGGLETLVGMLDTDRHITLFGSPQFLAGSGRPMVTGPWAGLIEPLEQFAGEEIQAAAVSLHLGERSYVELDAVAAVDLPVKTLAARIAGRLAGLIAAAEDRAAALNPDPYGRTLVRRLPAMLQVLAAELRSGPEGKGVVLNAYLPRHAPHNIALAAELALAQASGRALAADAAAAAPGAERALEKLNRRITLTFAKDNLERSIQIVAEETGVPMEILGGTSSSKASRRISRSVSMRRTRPPMKSSA